MGIVKTKHIGERVVAKFSFEVFHGIPLTLLCKACFSLTNFRIYTCWAGAKVNTLFMYCSNC